MWGILLIYRHVLIDVREDLAHGYGCPLILLFMLVHFDYIFTLDFIISIRPSKAPSISEGHLLFVSCLLDMFVTKNW